MSPAGTPGVLSMLRTSEIIVKIHGEDGSEFSVSILKRRH
jgi:hypothetical protein